MEYAVSLSNISKTYNIYNKPIDRLKEIMWRGKKSYHRTCTALKPISLNIAKGTTFGILGKNGSGKSTLLQIIASILQPTTGSITVKGRISALLELGSGFNPEFTGLENVYLYGSVLGLSKAVIDSKIDEIIKFADIGHYISLPIKTYSSGMVVRLAFATAVSVDPDILIVDEALAVGDALFQHKCILKMRQIMNRGTTVIFVSHDIASIKQLCNEAILLEEGELVAQGTADEVSKEYHRRLFELETHKNEEVIADSFLTSTPRSSTAQVEKIIIPLKTPSENEIATFQEKTVERFGSGEAKIELVQVFNSKGFQTTEIDFDETFLIRIWAKAHADLNSPLVGFVLRNSKGVDLMATNTIIEHRKIKDVKKDELFAVDFSFKNTFRDEHYSINPAVSLEENFHKPLPCDWIDNAYIIRTGKPKNVIVYGLFYPESLLTEVHRGG